MRKVSQFKTFQYKCKCPLMPLTLFPGIPHVLWHTSFLLNQHCQGIFLKQTLGTAEPCIKCSVLPPYPCSLLSVRKSWSQTHHTATAILLDVGPVILDHEKYDLNPLTLWMSVYLTPVSAQWLLDCMSSLDLCPETLQSQDRDCWLLHWAGTAYME